MIPSKEKRFEISIKSILFVLDSVQKICNIISKKRKDFETNEIKLNVAYHIRPRYGAGGAVPNPVWRNGL